MRERERERKKLRSISIHAKKKSEQRGIFVLKELSTAARRFFLLCGYKKGAGANLHRSDLNKKLLQYVSLFLLSLSLLSSSKQNDDLVLYRDLCAHLHTNVLFKKGLILLLLSLSLVCAFACKVRRITKEFFEKLCFFSAFREKSALIHLISHALPAQITSVKSFSRRKLTLNARRSADCS